MTFSRASRLVHSGWSDSCSGHLRHEDVTAGRPLEIVHERAGQRTGVVVGRSGKEREYLAVDHVPHHAVDLFHLEAALVEPGSRYLVKASLVSQ